MPVNRRSTVQAWPNKLETERVGSDDAHVVRPGWKVLDDGAAEAGRGKAKDRLVTERSPGFELTDPCLGATNANECAGRDERESDSCSDPSQLAKDAYGTRNDRVPGW